MFDFYQELAKGGWVMVPIGLVSVLALGLFLERIFTLRRARVFPGDFVERIRGLIRANRTSEALVLCQRNASSMALVIAAGLVRSGDAPDRIREAVEERGRLEAGRLDRFIEGLGTIAAIAPLLGLLGTVLGMIDVFKEVDAHTKAGGLGVNPGVLASGIWKALITTAAGLTVAIPTFVGYKYLGTRINRLVLDMEESAAELVELLSLGPTAGGAAAAMGSATIGAPVAGETGPPASRSSGEGEAPRGAEAGADGKAERAAVKEQAGGALTEGTQDAAKEGAKNAEGSDDEASREDPDR